MRTNPTKTLRATAFAAALASLAATVLAGEIQSIKLDNFGPYVEGVSVRTIFDRPFADVGAVSYGEIGWDPVKAVDPGIAVFNNVPAYNAKQIIADCVMAPRTAALIGEVDEACNDGFQTHKRFKMSANSFGPIDMVFTVKNVDANAPIYDKNDALVANDQDVSRNVYRMIGKLNNHTGKRMAGFKVELGHGLGASFVAAADATNLKIALREEGATDPAADLGQNDMAEFPGGLFYGPADDKHDWGFFSSERAGFTVEQTALKTGTVTFTSQQLFGEYEAKFGKWLPINWVPTGWFFDFDGNPGTDAQLVAWNNSVNWLTYDVVAETGARTERTVEQATLDMYANTPATIWNDDSDINTTTAGTKFATWNAATSVYDLVAGGTMTNDEMAVLLTNIEDDLNLERRPGYLQGPIEDLANLNLNYYIEVADISNWPGYNSETQLGEFTLRITPLEAVGDDGVTPPWVPVEPTPPTSSDDGGGCSAATGERPVDPVLPLLAALGLIGWGLRRARRA